MKLCITSTGKQIDSKIDARFGRAPYFLIVDTDTSATEVVPNSAADDGQGAGIGAAQLVSSQSVDGVLTGRVGPNALNVLRESGINLYEGASPEDTVKEALDKFKKGEHIAPPASSEIPPRAQVGGKGLGQRMGGRGRGRGMGGGRGRIRQEE